MTTLATEPQETQIVLAVPPDDSLPAPVMASLQQEFGALFVAADEWRTKAMAINVTDVSQVKEMKAAKACRTALKDIRCDAEKVHKRLKERSLREGRAIDGVRALIRQATEPLEERLLEMEQFAIRKEAQRKEDLASERRLQLEVYGVDTSIYQLGEISDDAFANILDTNRLAYEVRAKAAREAEEARVAAENKAEEERVAKEKAEAEERARVRAENERLKAEAAAQEEALRVERARVAVERKAAEDKARQEREAIEAKAKAEREAAEAKAKAEREAAAKERARIEEAARVEREKAEAAAKIEREARAKVEAELKAQRDAEEARRKAEAAAQAKAAKAPDKQKIVAFAATVRSLPTITATTKEGKALVTDIAAKVESFAKWIETRAAELD